MQVTIECRKKNRKNFEKKSKKNENFFFLETKKRKKSKNKINRAKKDYKKKLLKKWRSFSSTKFHRTIEVHSTRPPLLYEHQKIIEMDAVFHHHAQMQDRVKAAWAAWIMAQRRPSSPPPSPIQHPLTIHLPLRR